MATFQIDVSQVLEKHILGFVKKKKKSNKLRSQWNRFGRSDWGVLNPWYQSRTQQEKDRLLFFSEKRLSQWIVMTVFYISPTFLFRSINGFSFPCCVGTCMCLPWLQRVGHNLGSEQHHGCRLQIAKFFLISSKTIFAGEITGSLFVLVQ